MLESIHRKIWGLIDSLMKPLILDLHVASAVQQCKMDSKEGE